MQRRLSVFAWAVVRLSWTVLMSCMLMLGWAATAKAQGGNTAGLSGTVMDERGGAVRDAKVTATNRDTDSKRDATTDDNGRYVFVGLAPGRYKLAVSANGFELYTNSAVELTVGQAGTVDVTLKVGSMNTTVEVNDTVAQVETQKTEVSQTVGQTQITNLPINGRDFKDFSLTNSIVTRDNSPAIGPAPNSGLSVSGQRARSNEISIDGADAVDNSVNAIRATVSQEAVQEFQMILSNYNAEYGRAMGGVVNIVTKSGGNEVHGDVFGFLRNKSFQARNAFSGQVDPTGVLQPVKQPFTRAQAGATIGGPIVKDKTFFFFSYEGTWREETGFSSIGENNFGLLQFVVPTSSGNVPVELTPSQGVAMNQLLASGNPQLQKLGAEYGILMGSASSVALNRLDYGAVSSALTGGVLNPGPGPQFPLPVTCPAGQTVNAVQCSAIGYGVAPLPNSYVALNSLRGNYPITEKTSLWSLKLDQNWSNRNQSFIRAGVSPSFVTGLQTTSQNQVFGQNAGSRTGVNQSRDLSFTFQNNTTTAENAFNQFRFQFARRGIHYGFSELAGGDQIGVNIPGYAYFGREPYSTVDRIERRYEFTDHIAFTKGRHTFKFGGDFNLIQLRSAKAQIFELDFGGDVNFGGLAVSSVSGGQIPDSVAGITLPGTTGFQSYGLGIPTTYIQGIGNSNEPFDSIPIGFFGQDTWVLNKHLTLNYGVRYDYVVTPLFAPATSVNAAAEKALGVIEGIPRDSNNVAPRVGIAWDPTGSGKTVVRAGYGLFYDNPLLAIAFNATTADGGRSVQLISAGGTPSACGLVTTVCGGSLDTPTNLNGSSIFQGVLNALPSMFYLYNQQRFDPLASGSLFANQNYLTAGFPLPILPFTLPIKKNFVFGYAQQANLTIEREITKALKFSVGYQYTRGLHLNKPVDINSTDPQLLTQNLFNADAAGLGFTSPVTVAAPSSNVAPTASTCGVGVIAPSVLGKLFGCPAPLASLNGAYVGTPAFFNFFRPSGPNPSFAGLVTGGFATQVALAQLAGYPAGFGVPVPFNSVDAQTSDGSSVYHGLTANVSAQISRRLQLLSSYTWSHTIDDSTDLQSTLEAQDSRFPQNERANSDFDQRHRWVTSAVFQTETTKAGDGFARNFLRDFTIAPIIEVSSGRPFAVITGTDYRLDLGSSNGRPSVGGSGGTTSPYIPGVTFSVPSTCLTNSGTTFTVPGITPPYGCNGNLGRNPFNTPGFFQFDLRVSKIIPMGERWRLNLIAEGFNLTNRTNVIAVNQLCDPAAGSTCAAGQPTSAADARQFQFALKVIW